MRIGDVGRQVGVDTATIRYYEGLGLVPEPPRTPSGYRDYGEDVVDRLRFVREAQASGLSLAEIGSILEMRDHGERTCDHVTGLLERHLEDIERQLAALRDTRRALRRMLERAESLDPGECVDPHRCQTIEVSLAPSGPTRAARRSHHPGHPA